MLEIAELDKMIKRKNEKSSLLDKTITLIVDIILIIDLITDLTNPIIDLSPEKEIDLEIIIIREIIDLNQIIETLRPDYHNHSNNYNRSQSHSQSREKYRNNNRRFSDRSCSRSSTPYPRDIYIADTVPDFTYEQFETFLNNTSIQAALTEYLIEENINITQTSNYTTPVKCNIKLQNQPYQAIIDSGASISMISYKVVKDLGLKIESPSTSLIISAAGSSVRPLGIIKNLPIEIEGTTIPIDVEVIDATTYSVLLGNDWSQKVDATYNWKNKAYTLK